MLQRISDLQLDPSTFGEKDIETAMAFRRFKGVARTIAHEMFHLRLKEASGEGERDVQRREARAQRKAESDAAWQQKKDDGELSLREGWRMIQNERQKIQGERKELEGEIVSMNASYTCEEGFARFVGAWAQGNINNSYTAVEAELKEGRWRSYEDLVSKGRYEDGHYLALALWHLPGTEADFKDFAGDFLRRVESARDQQGPRLNLFTVLEEELRARRRADFSLADYYSRFYAQAVKAVRADQEAAYERLVLDGFLPLQS
jgi:hypothetical protein